MVLAYVFYVGVQTQPSLPTTLWEGIIIIAIGYFTGPYSNWVELETEPKLSSPKAGTLTHRPMVPPEQQASFNICKNGGMLTIPQGSSRVK